MFVFRVIGGVLLFIAMTCTVAFAEYFDIEAGMDKIFKSNPNMLDKVRMGCKDGLSGESDVAFRKLYMEATGKNTNWGIEDFCNERAKRESVAYFAAFVNTASSETAKRAAKEKLPCVYAIMYKWTKDNDLMEKVYQDMAYRAGVINGAALAIRVVQYRHGIKTDVAKDSVGWMNDFSKKTILDSIENFCEMGITKVTKVMEEKK